MESAPKRTYPLSPSRRTCSSSRPRRSSNSAAGIPCTSLSLRAEHDFERGSPPRSGPEREAAVDRLRPRAHVLQPLSCGAVLAVEARAVVADGHEAISVAPADDDVGMRRVRVLAHVGESFLHDAEDLDLLVGRE